MLYFSTYYFAVNRHTYELLPNGVSPGRTLLMADVLPLSPDLGEQDVEIKTDLFGVTVPDPVLETLTEDSRKAVEWYSASRPIKKFEASDGTLHDTAEQAVEHIKNKARAKKLIEMVEAEFGYDERVTSTEVAKFIIAHRKDILEILK